MSDMPQPVETRRRFGRGVRGRLTHNPVVLKELRGRMRGARAFVVLTAYLLFMSGFATLLYYTYTASTRSTLGVETNQWVGKIVFGGVVGIELFLVSFIAPAFTAGAISSERERQTYDLLRTTLLPARALVLGKLVSALSYVLLLLLVALPLQSLAFLLGGVAIEEVLIAAAILLVTALASGSMGLFCSSLTRRTLSATVLTYAFALLTTVGLPLLLLIFLPLTGGLFPNTPSPAVIALLAYGGGLLISLNPLTTAIATEVILIEEQSALYFTLPVGNGTNLPLVSPWIVYVALYLALSALLIWASVRLVKRVSD